MSAHDPSDDDWESILSPGPSFAELCAQIHDRVGGVERLEAMIGHEHLAIADLVIQAKSVYEATTGTGKGKRNPANLPDFAHALAEAVGKESTWVYRYVNIAKLDAETRELVGGNAKLCGTQSILLALAREPNITTRKRAIAEYEAHGRKAFDEALRPLPVTAELRASFSDESLQRDGFRHDVLSIVEEKTKKQDEAERRAEQRRIDASGMVDYIKGASSATLGAIRKELGFSSLKARRLIQALIEAEIVYSLSAFTGKDSQRFGCELEDHEINFHKINLVSVPSKPIVLTFPSDASVRIPEGRYRVAHVDRDPVRVVLTRVT